MNQILEPEEFRTLRGAYGLSQAKIAREVGLKRSYISQFENGRYQFREKELLQLRSYLDEYFYEFHEQELGDSPATEHPEQEKLNQFADLDECLIKIREILATPTPKMLLIFDDDEDIDRLKGELLLECLSLARKCADARGHLLGDWDDETAIASRIYR